MKAHLVQGFTIERAGDNPHSETAMGAFKLVRTTADSGERRGPRDFVITRAYVNAIRYVPQGVQSGFVLSAKPASELYLRPHLGKVRTVGNKLLTSKISSLNWEARLERHDGLFDIYNFNRNASTTRII